MPYATVCTGSTRLKMTVHIILWIVEYNFVRESNLRWIYRRFVMISRQFTTTKRRKSRFRHIQFWTVYEATGRLQRNLILILCSYFAFCIFRPKSGSMLLYSRKKVRYRRDGYCWKKRKDGKTTREDHMKLKVQGTEVSAIFTCIWNIWCKYY